MQQSPACACASMGSITSRAVIFISQANARANVLYPYLRLLSAKDTNSLTNLQPTFGW